MGTTHVRELEELRGGAQKDQGGYNSPALALGHLADKEVPLKSPFSVCLSLI